MERRQKISPSEKDAFLECRLKWQYEYVEGVERRRWEAPLMRGTAGHAAMEAFYGAVPQHRSLEMLLANFNESLREQVKGVELEEWEEEEVRKAKDTGVLALQTFWRAVGKDGNVPNLETEVRLARMLPSGAEYHGVADAVWRRDDSILIGEFKFPADVYGLAHEYLYWSGQHRAYAWMLNSKLPVYVQYSFVTPKRFWRTEEVLVGGIEEEAEIADWVTAQNEVYPTYDFHCLRCDFNKLCMARLTGGI